jgi:hypothetical protein
MTTTALRKELQGYIEAMPEYRLSILKPLLVELAEPLYTIEPANEEEIAMIDERMKDYERDPSSFVSLTSTTPA